MFLRRSFLVATCLSSVLLSAHSFATTYEITSTADTVIDDGVCTLREAIQAINTRLVVDNCPAGVGNDVIHLTEDASYELVAELGIGGQMSADTPSVAINPTVTIKAKPDDAFDKEFKVNPRLYAAQDARVFKIEDRARLIVENITLDGMAPGVVATNGPPNGLGGLIYSEGGLAVSRQSILQNGVATADGGAVYLAADNIAFTIDNSAFIDNSAVGNGGAIATTATFTGIIGGEFLYLANNVAGTAGGAIYLDGAGSAMALENGTFYGNSASDGGAIRLAADERIFILNNMTIAGQDGGGGISFAAEASAGSLSDRITNSIIVGNVGGSCVGDAAAITGATLAYVLNEGGTCPNDQGGFVQTGPGPADNIPNDEDAADFSVLAGIDPGTGAQISCPSGALGSVDCEPAEFDGSWNGFLPSLDDAIGAVDGVPTALNSASPFGSTQYACATLDQRSNGREDDCDAGAIELTSALGQIDEFIVVTGTINELDVLANDLGDTTVDCSLPSLAACLEILIPPSKGTLTVDIDANNQPVLTYQSFPNEHGVDRFSYRVTTDVIVGPTRDGADIGALANVVVEPASGLLESDSIGGLSWLGLFFAVVAGSVRRIGGRALLAALTLMLVAPVQAATITVTSTADDTLADGFCTLREAIANASSPTSADCAFGDASGTDTILLPEGVITLSAPLTVPTRASIDIIGTGADATLATSSIVDGAGTYRILSSLSRLRLSDLVLQNGASGDRGGAIFTSANLSLERVSLLNNSALNGGAVFLSFNSDEQRTLSIKSSEFNGNTASLSGGAVSMVAQNQRHVLQVESSSFIGNTAGAGGGALDVNLPKGGDLRVSNSTFYNNIAASGGGAIDLQDAPLPAPDNATTPIYIYNSTFINNGEQALDLGNIDPTAVDIQMHNSVYFDTFSGAALCASGAGTGSFRAEDYNVFGMRPAAPSSCHQNPQSSNSQDRDSTELATLLDVSNPIAAAGEFEDFVPTHFAIDAGDANTAYLVDAGKGAAGELVSGFGTPLANCREFDLRGVPRTAGAGCDIGAYELRFATSVDDTGANSSREGNYAIVDVVENDVAGEQAPYIVPYAIDLDPSDPSVQTTATAANGGTVRLVGNTTLASLDEDCGWEPGSGPGGRPEDAFEACLVRYEPPAFLDCPAIDGFTDTFTYAAIFNDAEDLSGTSSASLPGTVTITVNNRPPTAPDVTVVSSPGEVVVFPFKIEDPENISITDPEYEIKDAPVNAKYNIVDQERVYLGVGIIIDTTAGTLTYIPNSVSSPFDERFSIGYRDECGAAGTTTFVIDYPDGGASGDALGSGSLGGSAVLAMLLLLGRRRFYG